MHSWNCRKWIILLSPPHPLVLETYSLDISNMFLPHFSCPFSCSCVTAGNFCQGVATKVPYIPWPIRVATGLEVHYIIRPNINERELHFHSYIISKCKYNSLSFLACHPAGNLEEEPCFSFLPCYSSVQGHTTVAHLKFSEETENRPQN